MGLLGGENIPITTNFLWTGFLSNSFTYCALSLPTSTLKSSAQKFTESKSQSQHNKQVNITNNSQGTKAEAQAGHQSKK